MPEVKIGFKPGSARTLNIGDLATAIVNPVLEAFNALAGEAFKDKDIVVDGKPYGHISRNRLKVEIVIVASATPDRVQNKDGIALTILNSLRALECCKNLFEENQISVWLQLPEGCFIQA